MASIKVEIEGMRFSKAEIAEEKKPLKDRKEKERRFARKNSVWCQQVGKKRLGEQQERKFSFKRKAASLIQRYFCLETRRREIRVFYHLCCFLSVQRCFDFFFQLTCLSLLGTKVSYNKERLHDIFIWWYYLWLSHVENLNLLKVICIARNCLTPSIIITTRWQTRLSWQTIVHDRPIQNFRASGSGNQRVFCCLWILCEGFWSSQDVKESVGICHQRRTEIHFARRTENGKTLTFKYMLILNFFFRKGECSP